MGIKDTCDECGVLYGSDDSLNPTPETKNKNKTEQKQI